jgi:hypothetical protein
MGPPSVLDGQKLHYMALTVLVHEVSAPAFGTRPAVPLGT